MRKNKLFVFLLIFVLMVSIVEAKVYYFTIPSDNYNSDEKVTKNGLVLHETYFDNGAALEAQTTTLQNIVSETLGGPKLASVSTDRETALTINFSMIPKPHQQYGIFSHMIVGRNGDIFIAATDTGQSFIDQKIKAHHAGVEGNNFFGVEFTSVGSLSQDQINAIPGIIEIFRRASTLPLNFITHIQITNSYPRTTTHQDGEPVKQAMITNNQYKDKFIDPKLVPNIPGSVSTAIAGASAGASSAALATSTAPITRQMSCNTQKCKEIDQIWEKIRPYMLLPEEIVSKAYDPETNDWLPFSTKPTAPVITGGGSFVSKNKIAQTALRELQAWNLGTLKETDVQGLQIIKTKYWPACRKDSYPLEQPWSAAFISFVLKDAGVSDFPASCGHIEYFKSIRESSGGSCSTHKIQEINSIQPGDIVCQCRGDTNCRISYDYTGSAEAHCDIVVERIGNSISVIGGNLGNSVKKESKSISSIAGDAKYFGFITCGSGNVAQPVATTSSTSTSGGQITTPRTTTSTGADEEIADPQVMKEITANKYDRAFLTKLEVISQQLGINPVHLLTIMRFEDNNFKTDTRNPSSGAVGLIQFTNEVANTLGTTTNELAAMTQIRQLDFVRDYFNKYKTRIRPNNFGDVAMAIFQPNSGIGQPDSKILIRVGQEGYSGNKNLDKNGDGISRGEYIQSIYDKMKNENNAYDLSQTSFFKHTITVASSE